MTSWSEVTPFIRSVCAVPGSGFELRYVCCQAETGAQGCHVNQAGHVYDDNKWKDRDGFLTLLPALPRSSDAPPNVYALDCEMVYTTGG